MKSLFIIGNGFDLAHKLPTKYSDFQKFLEVNYGAKESPYLSAPEGTMLPKGEIYYDRNEVANFLYNMINNVDGDRWSDLENTMGLLSYEELLTDLPILFDKEGDENFWKNSYTKEDFTLNLIEPILMIKEFFNEWIKSISITNKTKKILKFDALINENDLFLNFNYTKTLQKIYNVEKICHIHGLVSENLFFGHGKDFDKFDYFQSKYTGSEYNLSTIHSALKKDIQKAYKNNYSFFCNLNNEINNIYSFGFSYSEIDEFYIAEIIKKTNSHNTVWHFNDFDNNKTIARYEKVLRKYNFKGLIEKFNCD